MYAMSQNDTADRGEDKHWVTMSQNSISGQNVDVERDKTIKTLANTITTLYEGDLKELNGKLNEFTWVIEFTEIAVHGLKNLSLIYFSGRQEQLQKEVQVERDFFAKEENWRDTQNLVSSGSTNNSFPETVS